MKPKKSKIRLYPIILSVLIFSCASSDKKAIEIPPPEFEKEIPEPEPAITEKEADPMLKYLVMLDDYTTNGSVFHKKYISSLKKIAFIITEEKKLTIKENSIGFYYDKKGAKKDKLYLGIDIIVSNEYTRSFSDYQDVAAANIRKYLWEILRVFQIYDSIFSEQEIIGSVVGMKWNTEAVNIWLENDEIQKFKRNEITFNELIQRNIVTDTKGKIIKLKL